MTDKLTEKQRRKLMQDYSVWEEDSNGNIKLVLPNLGELIFNAFDYNFLTTIDNKEIHYYNGGFYEGNGDPIIKHITGDFLATATTEHFKKEVVGFIRDKNYQKRDIFYPPVNLINLRNGIYDIDSGDILEHTPNHHFINEIPVNYDPDASSEDFKFFLQDICMQQKKRREIIEKTIQEYMGYSLYRAYPYKKYIVLDGGGDNAKTTLFDIMLGFIGAHNNTSVSLQELNNRPFTKVRLFGKHTNISDDLPKKGLKYTGVIKQITGNSPIWADIKNHPKGIEFIPYAKPWYACNELPETEDITDAFFSRQLQITLLNKYLPKGSKEIDNHTIFEADTELVKILTTPEQLSGILNFALQGLKRLMKQDRFSLDEVETTEMKRETWLRKTNPVHAFLEDEIETTNDDWVITVDNFFSEIVNYCDTQGFDKPTRHKVTTKMHDKGMKKQQKTINNEPRVWCWVGIRSTTDTAINHYLGARKDGFLSDFGGEK